MAKRKSAESLQGEIRRLKIDLKRKELELALLLYEDEVNRSAVDVGANLLADAKFDTGGLSIDSLTDILKPINHHSSKGLE